MLHTLSEAIEVIPSSSPVDIISWAKSIGPFGLVFVGGYFFFKKYQASEKRRDEAEIAKDAKILKLDTDLTSLAEKFKTLENHHSMATGVWSALLIRARAAVSRDRASTIQASEIVDALQPLERK